MKTYIASLTIFLSFTINYANASLISVMPLVAKEKSIINHTFMLLSFNVKRSVGCIELNWKTNNEHQVAYFLVQRSEDNKRFVNIYEQPAFISDESTSDIQQYSIKDNKVINNVAYYRLVTVNKNGEEKISQVVKI